MGRSSIFKWVNITTQKLPHHLNQTFTCLRSDEKSNVVPNAPIVLAWHLDIASLNIQDGLKPQYWKTLIAICFIGNPTILLRIHSSLLNEGYPPPLRNQDFEKFWNCRFYCIHQMDSLFEIEFKVLSWLIEKTIVISIILENKSYWEKMGFSSHFEITVKNNIPKKMSDSNLSFSTFCVNSPISGKYHNYP